MPTAPTAARKPLAAAPVQPEEGEDFTFDLDLNPGLLSEADNPQMWLADETLQICDWLYTGSLLHWHIIYRESLSKVG